VVDDAAMTGIPVPDALAREVIEAVRDAERRWAEVEARRSLLGVKEVHRLWAARELAMARLSQLRQTLAESIAHEPVAVDDPRGEVGPAEVDLWAAFEYAQGEPAIRERAAADLPTLAAPRRPGAAGRPVESDAGTGRPPGRSDPRGRYASRSE
jgi:hypothetical protein